MAASNPRCSLVEIIRLLTGKSNIVQIFEQQGAATMLMTAADYRESLRAYRPRVFVNGKAVDSVADEPLLPPGVAAASARGRAWATS
jgi:hypothetical protein